MVRILLVVPVAVAVFLCTADLHADQPVKLGPSIIKLKMGEKTLEFTHLKHQQLTKNQCWECHDKSNGKIKNWSQTTAHKLCIPCHDLNEKGPVACKSCHPKK